MLEPTSVVYSEAIINQAQDSCAKQYLELTKPPFEQGTCKKVIHLYEKINNPEFKNIALAVAHETSGLSEGIIRNEHVQLKLLAEKGFSVVKPIGDTFVVTNENGKKRYGMLMEYIPNATFIEAKTPGPLKLLIYSCLLGNRLPSNETWYFEKEKIIQKIKAGISSDFSNLQKYAKVLEGNFSKLLALFQKHNLWIADLQILITQKGDLTVIDPLDTGHFVDQKTVKSIIYPSRENDVGFIPSLINTFEWLQQGKDICTRISEAKSPEMLIKEFEAIPTQKSRFRPY